MKKNVIRCVLAGLLALVLVATGCTGTQNNNQDPAATATPTPEPTAVPALTPQPEINDPGTEITYHVSNIFTSNMVVQRDKYIPVWGWADQTSGYIYGEFMGETRYAEIQSDGYWKLEFSPHEANTYSQTLKIYPKNGEVTELSNIQVGDVWFVSGQSNGELTMATATANLSKEEKTALREKVAADDNIRVLVMSRDDVAAKATYCATPAKELVRTYLKWAQGNKTSTWTKSSAIGYYFALALHDTIPEVPIGIVMMSAGGCSLSELMPLETSSSLGLGIGMCYYNAMINPFIGLPFTGMLFYQGESNANGDGYKRYASDLKVFVETLREKWDYDFPFYNVQLSCHGPDCIWTQVPQLRNSQFEALSLIPNSYIVVSMDKGYRTSEGQDWAHPKDKEPVGRRLADAALATVYKKAEKENNLSPLPISYDWKAEEVIITFEYVGGGLSLMPETGDKLLGFRYYEGGRYYDAEATIISANQVSVKIGDEAVSVGYGMENFAYPEDANLQSGTGYPCPAFEKTK